MTNSILHEIKFFGECRFIEPDSFAKFNVSHEADNNVVVLMMLLLMSHSHDACISVAFIMRSKNINVVLLGHRLGTVKDKKSCIVLTILVKTITRLPQENVSLVYIQRYGGAMHRDLFQYKMQ